MSKQRTWQSWFGFSRRGEPLIYLGVVLLLALLQRHLIYLPSRAREEPLLRQAERDGLHPWRDRDKRLIGWRTSPPDDGFAAAQPARGFSRKCRIRLASDLLCKRFPWHSGRDGNMGIILIRISGLWRATRLAERRKHYRRRHVKLLRISFKMTQDRYICWVNRWEAALPPVLPPKILKSVSGLFLVTPLTCLADVAASHYRFLPVRLMLREHHDVQAHLKAFPGPVAFLVAGRDEVMSDNLGEKLYSRYSGRKTAMDST